MIRTNLSTRPFYNERVVRLWLLGITGLVLVAGAFNVSRVIGYSRSDTQLKTAASQNENRAAELRTSAARLRATVDVKQFDVASADAHQANDLIDRRTFSWTELLNLFETTMPDNVRITAVRPKIDPRRGIVLTISVVARSVEDVNELMDKLEATSVFTDLLTPEERVDEQGQIEAALETTYRPRTGHIEKAGAKRP